MKQKKGAIKLNRVLLLIPLLAFLVTMRDGGPVLAQTSKDPWSTPLNISHSGSTTNPVAVRDANGVVHVVWQDDIAGAVYARLMDGQWSQPIATKFPFGEATPVLMADDRGFVHAFWINQADSLVYTRMNVTSVSLVGQRTQFLAKDVLAYNVNIDLNGTVHLAYITSLDELSSPAGVYYSQSIGGSGNWTKGKLLYPSQYFRGLDKKSANVSMASAGQGAETRLYVAWDNRPRKRVFFSMSKDGGNSWSEPEDIQAGDTSSDTANPYGIEVGAFSDRVLLLWQTGDPVIGCRQWFRWSADRGENWSSPSTMPTNVFGCPQKNKLLSNKDLFILLTSIQDQQYLVAWNGSQWSNPEFQRTLTGFVDPETKDTVLFGCLDPILLPDGQMLAVGCDEGTGGDVWVASRPVSDITMWFPPAPLWNPPLQIDEGNSPISSLELIADTQGWFHTIWTQSELVAETTAATTPKSVIYYSGNEGLNWSRPNSVLSSPNGDADQPSIAIDAQDRLMVVWRELQSGSIYFSWANASKASSPSEWASPQALPTVRSLVSSPMVANGQTDEIYVVFAIPINENRGIYITTSTDVGQTWSKPVQIVDAVAAGWEMVDQPQISVSADGHIHVMWKVLKMIGENIPLGIYYARSEDGGKNWSQPGLMVDSQVYWYQMTSSENSTVHLVWQESTFRGYGLRQQLSTDSGQTWSRPATIADLGKSLVPANLVERYGDPTSLVLVVEEPVNRQVLKQWTWQADKWSEDASLDLVEDPSVHVTLLGAALSSQRELGVIYNLEGSEKAGENPDIKLLFSERKVEPVETLPIPTAAPQIVQAKNTITPTESAIDTPEPTQTITPTLMPTQPSVQGRSNRGIILGVAITVVVIGLASGLAVQILLKRRTRS
jgi:hypothetical protein